MCIESESMGLSIKNDEVERLIRQLADRRGVSMTEALRQAVASEIARDEAARAAEVQARLARIMAIVDEMQRLPVLDNRSADEILGYDENGLPT
jgi:antitoxin VapB